VDAVTLLREEIRAAHDLLEAIMMDVTPEAARWMPTGQANPVGATYAHVVLSEDRIVNGVLRHQKPLYETTWAGKMGLSLPMPSQGPDPQSYIDWTRNVQLDLPTFREYAKGVYAATDQYLASLTEEDLSRPLDLSGVGMGQESLGWVLGRRLVGHVDNIAGEISCLKGLQGLRGYPF
jgi:DinB superfamily